MAEMEKSVKNGILGAYASYKNYKFVMGELSFFMLVLAFYLGLAYSIDHALYVVPIYIIFLFLLRFNEVYTIYSILASLAWGVMTLFFILFIILGPEINFYINFFISLICGIIVSFSIYRVHKNIS